MSDDTKKSGPTAFRADDSGKIIVTGGRVSGFPNVAEATKKGRISLKNTLVDKEPNRSSNGSAHNWYQRPIGIVLLAVIAGLAVAGFSVLLWG